jgi:periplasmic protein TonB
MEDTAAYPLLELPPALQENSRFTAAIIAALALHLAALVIGFATPAPQLMGEATGSQEGVTVEIADENEISGRTAQPAVTPPPKPATAPATEAPPSRPAPDLKPSTHEEAPTPAKEEAKEAPEPAAPALENLDPNLFKIQPDGQTPDGQASNKQAKPEPKPHQPAKPTKPAAKPEKPAQMSMTVPMPSFTSSSEAPGRSAGVSRPAGITRSGLNDEFGRGVIRALRQTMPPNNRIAQATVRFVLSKDGNLSEVELVSSSGDPILDQNVVFAVKQANFPIPATNLTALDRQFRVTYVYR